MDKPADTTQPIHNLIAKRWSPRAFSDRPVSAVQVKILLEAARWSASSFNEQPWAFLVATKDDPMAYAKMVTCLVEGNRTWAKYAPVLMITSVKLAFDRNGKPNAHARHDLGLAVQNLVLQATSMDLYVHQMAGIVPETCRKIYAIPETHEPVTGIAIGHMGDLEHLPEALREREKAPRTRKPLGEIAFSGTWGRAFGS